jgi:hypothetical protein
MSIDIFFNVQRSQTGLFTSAKREVCQEKKLKIGENIKGADESI